MRSHDVSTGSRMLGLVLENQEFLRLTREQELQVSRRYWHNTEPPLGVGDAQAFLQSIFDSVQAERFKDLTAAARVGSAWEEHIERRINVAIEERLRTGSVVEAELAAVVAAKLIDWTKLFAAAVALPLALILVILAFMGVEKINDLNNLEKNADSAILATTKRVDASLSKSKERLTALDKSITDVNSRAEPLIAAGRESVARLQAQVERLRLESATKKEVQDVDDRVADVLVYSREQLDEATPLRESLSDSGGRLDQTKVDLMRNRCWPKAGVPAETLLTDFLLSDRFKRQRRVVVACLGGQ
jgi:hypothetical protein